MTVPAPSACERCSGDGVVERGGRLRPCPDCRCVRCVRPAVGLCGECEAEDFVAADTAYRRRVDV